LKTRGSVKDLELIQEEDTNPSVDTSLGHEKDDQEIDEPQSDINPIRKSSKTRRAPNRMCLYIDAEEHELGDIGEPANYKVTLLDLESKKWLDAMNVEMQSMKDNDVWVLVELPPNARTVGSKWLFKKKTNMDGKCVSCMSGKMARKPYSHQVERDKDLLGLIHTDVCGPFKIVSRQGASYFVTFTDDFSRYGYVYLLKHKHEVFETFKVFQKEVENQLRKTIKSLRSDRGGEYMSQEFLDHLNEHGIIARRTPPYTPHHNRVSERRNRTLVDMVDKTPYEIWHGQARKLSYLKVWGCETFVKRDTLTKPNKLDPRSFKSIFVGYPKETMGYSFYSPSENKVYVARNAEFFESKLLDLKASGSVEDPELIQEEDTNHSADTSLDHEEDDQEIDKPQSDINPIRKSSRTRRAPDRMCLYNDAEEHELEDLGKPANYKAALLDLESKKWLDAMNVEMQSMKDNDEWVLVELPPNARTVGRK
nr:hypothetical protein [Tanacetum cinerariifolium]